MSHVFPTDLPKMGIYLIRCVTSGKPYVGKSVRIRGRWKDHIAELRAGRGYTKLQKEWDLYGESAFSFEILEVVEDASRLKEREQFYLDALKACGESGLNTLPSSGSFDGYVPDAEARRKIGEASRERWKDPTWRAKIIAKITNVKRPPKKPVTEATKRKIATTLTGVPHTEERRKAISNALKGKRPEAAISARIGSSHSEEAKRKIGDANRGKRRIAEQGAAS